MPKDEKIKKSESIPENQTKIILLILILSLIVSSLIVGLLFGLGLTKGYGFK